jgi:hypothetical protein
VIIRFVDEAQSEFLAAISNYEDARAGSWLMALASRSIGSPDATKLLNLAVRRNARA